MSAYTNARHDDAAARMQIVRALFMNPQIEQPHQAAGHAGDCTIYAAILNGQPSDGICTCGYGQERNLAELEAEQAKCAKLQADLVKMNSWYCDQRDARLALAKEHEALQAKAAAMREAIKKSEDQIDRVTCAMEETGKDFFIGEAARAFSTLRLARERLRDTLSADAGAALLARDSDSAPTSNPEARGDMAIADYVAMLERQNKYLRKENARLLAGDFTAEELQNFCHKVIAELAETTTLLEAEAARRTKAEAELEKAIAELAEVRKLVFHPDGKTWRDLHWEQGCRQGDLENRAASSGRGYVEVIAERDKLRANWLMREAELAKAVAEVEAERDALKSELALVSKERDTFLACDEACGKIHVICAKAGVPVGHVVQRVETLAKQAADLRAALRACRYAMQEVFPELTGAVKLGFIQALTAADALL